MDISYEFLFCLKQIYHDYVEKKDMLFDNSLTYIIVGFIVNVGSYDRFSSYLKTKQRGRSIRRPQSFKRNITGNTSIGLEQSEVPLRSLSRANTYTCTAAIGLKGDPFLVANFFKLKL